LAGRIPQDFIDDLVARADIAEVIGSRLQLKKHGREYKACCPFHSEKTPSFTVSSQKGFYHCFGCGTHGTALGFLMEFDRLEFPDAVEELAQMLGLEVPRDERTEQRAPVTPIYDVLAEAAQLYRKALKQHPAAVEYLKARGLDAETVQRFGIGYAPGGWDYLLRHFGDKDKVQRQLMAAGLVAERDRGGYYDRFRDRIVFPIRDSRGRVIGFGGRVIGDGEPKYLNSPETSAFHKGRELYGLYEARHARRKLQRILVVEGYMDVVSLACYGVDDAVGTLGTATTPEHLRRLFRATQEITFCFDGDRAGRDAAWRALQTSLPEMREGRQVRFLFLAEDEEPDSVVRREGAEKFGKRLEHTLPLSDYLLRELKEQTDMASMDGRARLAELALPLLKQLPDGVYKARPSLVRQAIKLTLNYPSICAGLTLPDRLVEVRRRGVPLLLELLEITKQRPDISSAGLLEKFRDRSEGPHLVALMTEEILVGEGAAATELADSLARIVDEAQHHRLEELVELANERSLNAAELDELRNLRRDDGDRA